MDERRSVHVASSTPWRAPEGRTREQHRHGQRVHVERSAPVARQTSSRTARVIPQPGHGRWKTVRIAHRCQPSAAEAQRPPRQPRRPPREARAREPRAAVRFRTRVGKEILATFRAGAEPRHTPNAYHLGSLPSSSTRETIRFASRAGRAPFARGHHGGPERHRACEDGTAGGARAARIRTSGRCGPPPGGGPPGAAAATALRAEGLRGTVRLREVDRRDSVRLRAEASDRRRAAFGHPGASGMMTGGRAEVQPARHHVDDLRHPVDPDVLLLVLRARHQQPRSARGCLRDHRDEQDQGSSRRCGGAAGMAIAGIVTGGRAPLDSSPSSRRSDRRLEDARGGSEP